MKNTNEDLLLGHLLEAHDPATQAEADRFIDSEPENNRRSLELLESVLAPLATDRDEIEPPSDLWMRTIARVAEHLVSVEGPPSQVEEPSYCSRSSRPAKNAQPANQQRTQTKPAVASVLSPASDPEICIPGRWNAFVSIGLVAAGLALLFPAVVHWRQQSERITCQNSMRRFHEAAMSYSDRSDGWLPRVEDGEKVAHIIALLEQSGSLGPNEQFVCAAAPLPSTGSNVHFANYSYTLGYRDDKGELRGLNVVKDDGLLPLLADAPVRTGDLHCSINHPHGQNVLFLGGNVRFCTNVKVGINQDDIFVNDDGKVGAGLRKLDTVLGAPEERP